MAQSARADTNSQGANGLLEYMNSPFVVTFLGGLIIFALTSFWQHLERESTVKREQSERTYDRKYNLLTQFTTEFPRTLLLAKDVQRRALWMRLNRLEPDAQYPDKRNFEQTRKKWESDQRELLERESGRLFGIQLGVAFTSSEVRSDAASLNNAWDSLMEAGKRSEVDREADRLEALYLKLVKTMSEEISGDNISKKPK